MTIKSGTWVGHLNAILGQGGGNLNEPVFKSSNAQGVAWGGMLKLQIDGRIMSQNVNNDVSINPPITSRFFHLDPCVLTCVSQRFFFS